VNFSSQKKYNANRNPEIMKISDYAALTYCI